MPHNINKIGCKCYLSQGDNIKEFAQELGAHPESIAALYRKLKRIERLPFFITQAAGAYKDDSVIDQMMEYIDQGINIIVEFGNFTSTFMLFVDRQYYYPPHSHAICCKNRKIFGITKKRR